MRKSLKVFFSGFHGQLGHPQNVHPEISLVMLFYLTQALIYMAAGLHMQKY